VGAVSLANALRVWLSSEQARELASHVDKGHVVLWLELRTSEEFGDLCGRLVQASLHLIELCNIKFGHVTPASPWYSCLSAGMVRPALASRGVGNADSG
jgi:hypothetical protein